MTDTRQALAALYKVVIARNRDGADWGEHFGPLMTALAAAKDVLQSYLQALDTRSVKLIEPQGGIDGFQRLVR